MLHHLAGASDTGPLDSPRDNAVSSTTGAIRSRFGTAVNWIVVEFGLVALKLLMRVKRITTPVEYPKDTPPPVARSSVFRSDIQAMRALAVSSVVVYHLWPGGLTGGFVGVDVFFVISGFLIGGHLLSEMRGTGRLGLGRFWVRRAKRLLPASLLVLLVVSLCTLAFAPLSVRKDFLDQVVGSVFYVQNWVLAEKSVDYMAIGDAASPVQHFWSLSVEEQLYVALPITLMLVLLATKNRLRAHRDRIVLLVLVSALVLSLTWSFLDTRSDSSVAYFSTGTRAWEFILGALVTYVPRIASERSRVCLGVVGFGTVSAAALFLGDQSSFPGLLALLPVLGTALMLLADGVGPVAWLGRARPVKWLGDISYAVYLWHWPIIILTPYATGEALTATQKMLVVVATLIISHISTFYLEYPVRASSRLLGGGRRLRTAAAWGLVMSISVAGLAEIGGSVSLSEQQRQFRAAQALVRDGDVRCFGAGAAHGLPKGCDDLGDLLIPPPASVALDTHNRTGCWATFGVSDLELCGIGSSDPEATRVLAVGDSHNNLYLIAYEQLAEKFGWHVDVAGRAGCSWSARPQEGRSETIAAECNTWKQALNDHIASAPPYDIIITTADSDGYLAVPDAGETAQEATVAGLVEAWSTEIARGSVVVPILDYPHARSNIVECVEQFEMDAVQRCSQPKSSALPSFDAQELAANKTPGSAPVTVSDLMCGRRKCFPVIGNVVVFRNPDHLTNTFVRTLVPFLEKRIPQAIDRANVTTGS